MIFQCIASIFLALIPIDTPYLLVAEPVNKGVLFYAANCQRQRLRQLYEIFNKLTENEQVPGVLLDLWVRYCILDYKKILALLSTLPTHLWGQRVFPVLRNFKDSYSAEDIHLIEKICDKLRNPKEVEKSKSLLNEYYLCGCGAKFSIADSRCFCGRNKYGFKRDEEYEIQEIIEFLLTQKNIIESNLV